MATLFTAIAAIIVSIWLEFRKRESPGAEITPPDTGLANSTSRLEAIRSRGSLRVGVINHPPLSSWSKIGSITSFSGYYVELAREVGMAENVRMEFVPIDWGVLSSSFTNLNLDLVLSIFETRARLRFGDFVACLHKVGVSGVMRADSEKITDPSHLSDPHLRIGVVVGEVGWEYVTHELRLPRNQLVQVDSGKLQTAFSPLVSGDADVAIVDDLTCAQFVEENEGFQHVFKSESLYICKNSIMVPRGEVEFSEWVDDVFLKARHAPHLVELEAETLRKAGGWVKKFR